MSDKSSLLTVFNPILSIQGFNCSIAENKEILIEEWKKQFSFGKTLRREPLWHSFSFNRYSNLSKKLAIKKFENTYLKNVIIFSDFKFLPIKCEAESASILNFELIKNCLNKIPNQIDLYICHKNFNWTFVITHEQDYGPYFATLTKTI